MNGCLSEVHLLQVGKFHTYWISWVRDFYTYFKSRRWIKKHNFCYIDTTETHINRFQHSVLSHLKTRLQLQINLKVLPNKFPYSLKRIVFRTDYYLLLSLLNKCFLVFLILFGWSLLLVFLLCTIFAFLTDFPFSHEALVVPHCCSKLLTYLGLNYLRQGQHKDIFLQKCSERYCVDIATKFKKFHNQRFWQILAKFSILKSLSEVYFILLYLFHDTNPNHIDTNSSIWLRA